MHYALCIFVYLHHHAVGPDKIDAHRQVSERDRGRWMRQSELQRAVDGEDLKQPDG